MWIGSKEELIALKGTGENSKIEIGNNYGYGNNIRYLNAKIIGKNVLVTPAPVIHNIGGHRWFYGDEEPHYDVRKRERITQFDDLITIVKDGFTSMDHPEENSYVKKNKKHRINYKPSGLKEMEQKNEGITRGDIFSLEIFPQEGYEVGSFAEGYEGFRIKKASPENISSINIQLAEDSTDEEKKKKMEFYKEQLDPLNIPYRFFTISEDNEGNPIYERIFPKKINLEGKVLGVISITGILLGVSFLYPVITGNIIGFTNNVNLIGIIFLVIGLIVGFFLVKKSIAESYLN